MELGKSTHLRIPTLKNKTVFQIPVSCPGPSFLKMINTRNCWSGVGMHVCLLFRPIVSEHKKPKFFFMIFRVSDIPST